MAGDAAHEARGGIVNDAAQDFAVLLLLGGSDAGAEFGVGQIAGVGHAERVEEDLLHVFVFRHRR